jgi:hypothetical protein
MKEKPDGYYEFGKLQPDLNTDELVELCAKKERTKVFYQTLRTINKKRISQERRAPARKGSLCETCAQAATLPALRLRRRYAKIFEIATNAAARHRVNVLGLQYDLT